MNLKKCDENTVFVWHIKFNFNWLNQKYIITQKSAGKIVAWQKCIYISTTSLSESSFCIPSPPIFWQFLIGFFQNCTMVGSAPLPQLEKSSKNRGKWRKSLLLKSTNLELLSKYIKIIFMLIFEKAVLNRWHRVFYLLLSYPGWLGLPPSGSLWHLLVR